MNSFISASSVNRLVNVQGNGVPITSFYLNTDPRYLSPRNVLSQGRVLLERGREHREASSGLASESMNQDLRSIQKYLEEEYQPDQNTRGLAMISCAEKKYFEAFHLPLPVKSRISFDEVPFLKPLLAVLDNFNRMMLVVVDHREARLFEVFLGQIEEHESFHAPIRGKIKAGGLAGAEERRIERSIENKIIHHYKEVADTVLEYFRRGHFDTLMVGIKEENYSEFIRVLHSYLRERLDRRVNLHPKSSQKEIIEEARHVEQHIRQVKNQAILERLIGMIGNDEAAVAGLPGVLRSIHLGACQTLVVDENYRESGVVCESCETIALSAEACTQCGGAVVPVDDVVGLAIEETLFQSGEIRFIPSDNQLLSNIQRIAAFLRFQV